MNPYLIFPIWVKIWFIFLFFLFELIFEKQKQAFTSIWFWFIRIYYPPWKRGDIELSLSVCLSVCPSVCPAWDRVLWPRELGMKELSFEILYTYKPASEVVPRLGFISIGWKLSILEHFKNCRFLTFFQMPSTLCRRVWSEAIGLEILYTYKPMSEVVPRQGFISISW